MLNLGVVMNELFGLLKNNDGNNQKTNTMHAEYFLWEKITAVERM